MNLEEAKQIVAQCVRNRFALMTGENPCPSLPDCSLEEMLLANRMVREAGPKQNPDGSTNWQTTVEPRGLAASYTLQHYGANPFDALEAMGFLLSPEDYEICRSCKMIDRRESLRHEVKKLPVCDNCFEALQEAANAEAETTA